MDSQLFSRRFGTFDFSGSIDRIDYHVLFLLWCRKVRIGISDCFFHNIALWVKIEEIINQDLNVRSERQYLGQLQ